MSDMNVKLTLWKLIQPFTPPPLWNFLGHWPPHPSGISNSLRGGGMDIFWNHTISIITVASTHNSWLPAAYDSPEDGALREMFIYGHQEGLKFGQ